MIAALAIITAGVVYFATTDGSIGGALLGLLMGAVGGIIPAILIRLLTGRPMRKWVAIEPEGVEDDDQLKAWVERATKFVGTLARK